ncbi:MAG: 23S rRNA (uracil(1939)-C(5))-methyltransferase RlmD [Lachnospiraceae bacterium]|nr:23S rRNA (uracil(1939)-C(5))-methyltransferase RlmD [Lachnospiraceae bacterium]
MKKGNIYTGIVERVDFPNKCIVRPTGDENGADNAEEFPDGEKVVIKNAIPHQTVRFRLTKKRKGKFEGMLIDVVKPADNELLQPKCSHFGECGGCTYQNLPDEDELAMKREQVEKLLSQVLSDMEVDVPVEIVQSPVTESYRNKMEFSFGDEYKNGPLALGMHKRGSFYDIVTVSGCRIVPADFRAVISETLSFFAEYNVPYLHKNDHTGYLRHLLLRHSVNTGEILADLVTAGQWEEGYAVCTDETGNVPPSESEILERWKDRLLSLESSGKLNGKIAGILHTRNDSLADVVKDEGTDILYGRDCITEELLGLKFKITPFSFFQTNSKGAEVLYETVREFVSDSVPGRVGKVLYDLYSGTGTIAQILSPVADRVIGVEIVEEAVRAAEENAGLNGLENTSFICGDVLKILDDIEEKPDYIILDPPRDGIHPKALEKIISYGVENMVYISCKPTSLARDLEVFNAKGYRVRRIKCVSMFPKTVHIETVVRLQLANA